MNPEQVKTFLEAFDKWACEQDQVGCYYDVDDKLGCAFHIWKCINIPFEDATKLYEEMTYKRLSGRSVFQAMITKLHPEAIDNFPFDWWIASGIRFIIIPEDWCRILSTTEIQFYLALLEYGIIELFEQAEGKEEDSDEYQELIERVYEFEREYYQEIY